MKKLRIEKITGRLISGNMKYKKIKYRGLSWIDISEFVKERDKKCLKCGNTKGLEADHFHPQCYIWIKQFFNHNKIQTLCKFCHAGLPSMKIRKKNFRRFVYFKRGD